VQSEPSENFFSKPQPNWNPGSDPAQLDPSWQAFVDRVRREPLPFDVHLKTFRTIFGGRRPEDGPPAVWVPDQGTIDRSNIMASMEGKKIDRYADFYRWSIQDRPAFWNHTLKQLGIVFTKPFSAILDLTGSVRQPRWFPDAELNIVDSCFNSDPNRPAVITPGPDGDSLSFTTYGELEHLVNRVAHGLCERGLAPERAITLYMPLSIECVVAYLAIIRAGSSVVSIADSFPAAEVRRRMSIAGSSCVVTLDYYNRSGKIIPLYDTVINAGASKIIVVPSVNQNTRLRGTDICWSDLLSNENDFESNIGEGYRTSNIIFSSGTTGDPKAIPWSHLTPIKSAMDGHYHQDIHAYDVTAWPTNIGWMMGPWLIYATLINGACMALYPGAIDTPDYARFIQRAGVTILGVIPSLVRKWRHNGITEGVKWPSIRLFSSTGEPASRTDYLWLMSRTNYSAPIIEYLGGTEIGGGHLACTVLQPCSPATFTTANLGVDFVILDENGIVVNEGGIGELFLMPPALGMSQRLLNGDHDKVYFDGCPAGPQNLVLRRHGDNTQQLHRGYYRSQGRADDAINLGGIKVGPVELEYIIDNHPSIYESAALAVQPEGEGSERLVVFIVPEKRNTKLDVFVLKKELQTMISSKLNPLFKIHEVIISSELPHTASGKIVRRKLRKEISERM